MLEFFERLTCVSAPHPAERRQRQGGEARPRMNRPAPGDRGAATGGREQPLTVDAAHQRRQRALDLRQDVAECVRRIDVRELLTHAATTGQLHGAGLAHGVPVTGLVEHLFDGRDGSVPAREQRRERHRQRAIERLLHIDRDLARLLESPRLRHAADRTVVA